VATLFLPDNTVLVNFALIHRMDLLGDLLANKGSWCLSVARECARSAAADPKFADMNDAATIFGTPLVPDRAELVDTQTLRVSMAAPGEPVTQHLGEAETVAIISRRRIDGCFLTDDRGARTLAVHHGITVVSTWDLLRVAHRANKVSKPVLDGYLKTLKSEGRGQPPGVVDEASFASWLC
jgi:predicted nucleic acid-binding protein